jgi:transcription termination/antitermination protein NusG
MDMKWYALFVESRKEDFVKKMIKKYIDCSNITVIVPKRKLIERKQGINQLVYKNLFPGYVFVYTVMDVDLYYQLKQVPRFYKLLNYKHDYQSKETKHHPFTEIDTDEMRPVLSLINNEEIIDFSTVYTEGSEIRVIDGPLKGKEAIIKRINKRKGRAKICIELFAENKFLDVGIEVLSKGKMKSV